MISEDKYSDWQNQVLRQTCVSLNMGTVLDMKVDFILGTAYEMNISLDKRTYLGSLIG